MRILVMLILHAILSCSEEIPPETSSLVKQFSREEGYHIAADLKDTIEWIDLSSVIQGMQDYVSGVKVKGVSSIEGEENFYSITYQLFERESKKNLQEATDFLQKLSRDTTFCSKEDGKILYEILNKSDDLAPVVQKDSSPTLQYSIATLNGQEVVNTRRLVSGPVRVPLSETIVGFSKGVEGMHCGERRKLFIHPDLGYGQVGQVPPNSLLIVDVEVVAIE